MADKMKIDRFHKQYWDTCLFSNYSVCCNYLSGIPILDFFSDYLREFDSEFLDLHKFFTSDTKRLTMYQQYVYIAVHYQTGFALFNNLYANVKAGLDIHYLLSLTGAVFTTHFHLKTYAGFVPYNYSAVDIGGFDFLTLLHTTCAQKAFTESNTLIALERLNYVPKDGTISDNPLGITTIAELCKRMKEPNFLINILVKGHIFTIYFDECSRRFYEHDTRNPINDKPLQPNWYITYDFTEILVYYKRNPYSFPRLYKLGVVLIKRPAYAIRVFLDRSINKLN